MKNYIAYLKDNPEGYWFKNKQYGIGWTPATKAGWAVVGLFLLWSFGVVARFNLLALPESQALQQVIAPIMFGVFVLIVISVKTGEPLRWRGKSNITTKDELSNNN